MIKTLYEHTSVPFDARPTIWYIMGLPGSGKTAFVKSALINDGTFRINKDDLREMISNKKQTSWNIPLEKAIQAASRALGETALEQGFSIIIDDTGFNEFHRTFWKNLAKSKNYNMVIKFVDTDTSTCKERCEYRHKENGAAVRATHVQLMYDKNEKTITELRERFDDK